MVSEPAIDERDDGPYPRDAVVSEEQPDSHPAAEVLFVPQPQSVEDSGLSHTFLMELALKEFYFAGRCTGLDVTRALALPFSVTEEVLEFLRREHLIELLGSQGPQEQFYEYSITDAGRAKIGEVLFRSQYRGPAPVTLEQYRDVVLRQSVRHNRVSREDLERGLSPLVLDPTVVNLLGPAINSGESIFLYGPSGDGKTVIATRLGRLLRTPVLIPHAVSVNGDIIKVYDPATHEALSAFGVPERRIDTLYREYRGPERRRDQRWVICSRPVVVAGGELTLDRLELRFDENLRYHLGPLQMRANGGTLLIDDFGRQQIPPRDLLNRWIVPMDRRVEYLTLNSGTTIEVPFELMLIFSTNLQPAELADEAFLRRVRHKVLIGDPTEGQYREIFRRFTAARGLAVDEGSLDSLIDNYYRKAGRNMRACHPGDLVAFVEDTCRFEGRPTELTGETLSQAAEGYFQL